MSVKRYLLIFIASAATITAPFWYERTSNIITAQDIALIYSANLERNAFAYLFDDDTVNISSNEIGYIPSWDIVYNKNMVVLRNMITNNTGPVFWMDPDKALPTSGDYLTSGFERRPDVITFEEYNDESGLATQYIHSLGAVGMTNTADLYPLTCTLRKENSIWYWPTMETNRTPFCHYFYNTNSVFSGAWGPYNSWTKFDVGTNVYKFTGEIPKNYTSENVNISIVFNRDMILDPPTNFSFAYGSTDSQTVNVHQRGIIYPGHSCAIYKISGYNRDSGYFTASDNGTPIWHILSKTRLFLNEDQPDGDTFTVRLISSISANMYVDFTEVGSDLDISPSQILFTPSTWNIPQTITVKPIADGDNENGGSIIILTRSDRRRDYVAVNITEEDEPANFYIKPGMLTMIKTDSATAQLSLGIPQTGGKTVCNKIINTNQLNECYNILHKMTRTMAIITPSQMTYETATRYSLSEYEEQSDFAFIEEFLPDYTEDVWEALKVYTSYESSESTDFSSALLANISLNVNTQREYQEASEDGDPISDTFSGGTISWWAKKFTGCKLPYPGQEAIDSNKVVAITVYALAYTATGDIVQDFPPLHILDSQTNTAYTGTSLQHPSSTFGIVEYVPTVTDFNRTVDPDDLYYGFDEEHFKLRVIQLASNDGTEIPTFTLGNDTVSLSELTDGDISSSFFGWQAITPPKQEFFIRRTKFTSAVVGIKAFLVVVDWSWEFITDPLP